jgi:hypothetical protein
MTGTYQNKPNQNAQGAGLRPGRNPNPEPP